MFNIFKRVSDQLLIDRDQVFCPVRGRDTDIEHCAGCRWLTEMNPDGDPPFVRCRPESVWSLGKIWI